MKFYRAGMFDKCSIITQDSPILFSCGFFLSCNYIICFGRISQKFIVSNSYLHNILSYRFRTSVRLLNKLSYICFDSERALIFQGFDALLVL